MKGIMRQEFYMNRDEIARQSMDLRNELSIHFKTFSEIISRNIKESGDLQQKQMGLFANQLKTFQEVSLDSDNKNREYLISTLKAFEESTRVAFRDFNDLLRQKLDNNSLVLENLNKSIEIKLENIRETLNNQIKNLQDDIIKN
ncbi:MAG: hypothetical protein HC905_06050 [Bacteroidales bacterium]|nr:hypothetical protein [Bacteroidales bacterium]